MKRIAFILLIIAGIAVFSTAQTNGTGTSLGGSSGSFRQEGIASWYGDEFDGKPTASGEIFNSSLFTAAHPNLPFGTVLIITNKQNNRRVAVRVNDRGPFVAARIIDLSRAAADVIDMLITGTAPVIVEQAPNNTALGPAGEAPPVIASEIPETLPQPVPPLSIVEVPLEPVIPRESPAVPQPQAIDPVPQLAPQVASPTPQPQMVPQPVPQPAPQAALPAPQPQMVPQPAPQMASPIPQPQMVPQPVPQPAPQVIYAAPAARILGGIPSAGSTKLYRLQVGAYRVPRNAVEAFDKLKNAGLNPAYEQYGDLYRVVLARLRAAEIPSIAQTLGNAGFMEALIREETGL